MIPLLAHGGFYAEWAFMRAFPIPAPRREPGDGAGRFGMDAAMIPLLAHGGFYAEGAFMRSPRGSINQKAWPLRGSRMPPDPC